MTPMRDDLGLRTARSHGRRVKSPALPTPEGASHPGDVVGTRRSLREIGGSALALMVVALGCEGPATDRSAFDEVPLSHAEVDLRIGSIEGEGADVFGQVTGLALDDAGRIYVADGQAHEIRVFRTDGSHAFTIGQQGSGPGEMNSPCCLSFAPDGRLWVRDNGNARYVGFDLRDGGVDPSATLRMNHGDANRHVATTFSAAGGLIDIGTRPDPSTGDPRTVLFHLGADGQVEREVVAPAPAEGEDLSHAVQVPMGEVRITRYFHQPYGPRHVVAYGPAGSHADAVTSRYNVRWYSGDGVLLQVVSNPDAVGPLLTVAEQARADSLIAAYRAMAGAPMPFGVPARHPVIAALHFDSSGQLWVERTVTQGERSL